ncbi:GNAT family N-acetyltransferase [Glaciimonas sp. Gout2]|uniref:GNAT family N-acetyltransferase n=1 Tax=unclassified Glaciimonas TaxID=2644401 RepID=UPI002B23366A|nr:MULTISPECIES: GNAT family N-acetyltransferase [unclassified Glaciimonas]MEB0012028.1 GNAT family N-acetyltransferase [Glaciimonas sp. Cout2]MEB0084056.1 GNAT family N-acetyltransferase [Glaciimonas sp. Gout2]
MTTHARFEDMPLPYRDLFAKVQSGVDGIDFFSTLPWFEHLAETALSHRHRLRLYCIESGVERLLLPMCHKVNRNRFFGTRRLTALANYYTPLFGPVGMPSDTQTAEMLTALLRAAANDKPQWDTIDLHPLDVDGKTFACLLAGFQAASMPIQRYFCFGNWYLDVNGRDYQAYFNGLSSKLRNTITRRSRQLVDAKRLRIEIVCDAKDIEKSITDYEEIYRSSWKENEVFPTFIPGLIRSCAKQGALRLGIAYVDDQPAAAQIWIVHHRVASIYKLAYNERFTKLSIGTILTSRLMQQVIDIDKVREVDYLTGDDAYKKDWMSHRRERWGIIAFNLRTLRGAMSAADHFGRRRIKQLYNGIIH